MSALAGGCADSENTNPFASGADPDTGPAVDGSSDSGPLGGSSGGAATTDAVDETGEGDSTGNPIKLDVGSQPDPPPVESSCDAVDILFVIDNSLSMNEYQAQLALAWPTFVDAMWNNLPDGTDLHVGMTTTSFYDGSCSEFVFNCQSTASASTIDDHYTPPTEGNTGVNGEQGRLFEYDGKRYFEATVGGESGELKTWFSQAAVAAGETGCSFEVSSAAAAYPFHEANADYNAGFLRDEGAVLVVVVLTDEPDKSPEGAQAYYDMITSAKAGCGGDECIVITGLTDTCIEGANNQLWQLFGMFSRYQPMGSIDEPTAYADVVGAALAEVIGDTCDEIAPVG